MFILFLAMAVALVMCSSDDPVYNTNSSWEALVYTDHSATLAERYDPNDTWAIYWYLCGSDLETDAGLATMDLQEMMKVKLPENVVVIIEAGGSRVWHNGFDPNSNGRYIYDSNGLRLLEDNPRANMGDKKTLISFLEFCTTKYPADHQVVIFWNHGGGSIPGVIFDEQYGFDALSLMDIREAFSAVSTPSTVNPPFELIGFDACLMATIETAETLKGFAKWMVASAEMEPGIGWDYTGFLQALANDTGIGGAMLGKEICDSFYSACVAIRQANEATLSVINLQKIDPLLDAYHNIGAESLLFACQNASYVSDFGRAAVKAQDYGFNNSWDGYTNMVDLGDLVHQLGSNLLPEYGAELLNALDACVVYQVYGPFRDRSSGLACFYNYSGSVDAFRGFSELQADSPFRWLYYYELAGTLNDEGILFVQNLAFIYAPDRTIVPGEVESAEEFDLDDCQVRGADDGSVVMNLGSEAASRLTGVYSFLAYYDEDTGIIILLGRDNDIVNDWENGIFKNHFRGVWGCIDNTLVFMELTDEADDYQLYSIPVLLNGEEYSISVSYTYATKEYEILGARRGIDDNGMADRNLIQLQPGDVVEPLHYVIYDTADAEFEQKALEKFIVTENTRFTEEDLGDGIFFILFEMIDVLGNEYLSEAAAFIVKDGDISIFTHEDA